MKPGKDFEARMRRRLEQAGAYVIKLPDVSAPFVGRPEFGGAGESGAARARFAPKNPYDFVVLAPAGAILFRAIALELKTVAGRRFPISAVKPHQLKGLEGFPGIAGVLVELRGDRRCFLVPVACVRSWERSTGKKSMNLEDMREHCTELPRNTAGRERKNYYSVEMFTGGSTVEVS